jgi:hypothetical protein
MGGTLFFTPYRMVGHIWPNMNFFIFVRSVNVGYLAMYVGQVLCVLINVFGGRFCYLETILRSQGICFVLVDQSVWFADFSSVNFSYTYSVH